MVDTSHNRSLAGISSQDRLTLAGPERVWSRVKSTHFPPPLRSPFSLNSAEYVQSHQQKQVVDRAFIHAFDNLGLSAIGAPELSDLSGALKVLGLETWLDILDFIDLPQDLLNLCLTCGWFYNLCIGRLYKRVRIRSPFYHGDLSSKFSNVFDKDLIPLNRLMPLRYMTTRFPSKFPTTYQLAKHIQHLDIAVWHAVARSPALSSFPSWHMLRPNLVQYDLWKGYKGHSGILTLLLSGRANVPISIDEFLATILMVSLINLRSFSWCPVSRTTSKVIPPLKDRDAVLHRGWIHPHDHPFLTAVVWEQLKRMSRLRSLTVDFEYSDPLLCGRMEPALPTSLGYNPGRDGLVGFKNLVSLDLRGVGCGRTSDHRFPEIASVIADCIESGTLRNFSLGIERWWYFLIETYLLDAEKDLWQWVEDLWTRCFRVAEERRKRHKHNPPLALQIDFKLDFVRTYWQFKTISDYTFKPGMLVQLYIHSGHILDTGKKMLAKLDGKQLPNLRVLFLKTFLADANKIIKTTTGLRELYIVNPGSESRYAARLPNGCPVKQQMVAFHEAQDPIKSLTRTNWVLDTLIKNHLRSLEVLVIDEFIPVPIGDGAPGVINSLATWKQRGENLKELGVSLWGPWERIEAFLDCFPSLKCFHLFNPPSLWGVQTIPGAPLNVQLSQLDAFIYTPYYCNSGVWAYRITRFWAKDLLFSKAGSGRHKQAEATRWIGIGPWYIEDNTDWKWKWEEDHARLYFEEWRRPDFCGATPGTDKTDKKEWRWLEVSKMWRVLADYVPPGPPPTRL